jgi:hypothetical protein
MELSYRSQWPGHSAVRDAYLRDFSHLFDIKTFEDASRVIEYRSFLNERKAVFTERVSRAKKVVESKVGQVKRKASGGEQGARDTLYAIPASNDLFQACSLFVSTCGWVWLGMPHRARESMC